MYTYSKSDVSAKTLALYRSSLFLLFLAMSSAPLNGQELNAEEKLSAIKNSLVDLAIDSKVRIGAAAFIDSNGALHESSTITSDVSVGGIRVLSYLKEAGIPLATINANVFPDQSCSDSGTKTKRQALVRLLSDKSYHSYQRVGDHYLNEIGEFIEHNLITELGSSNNWKVSKDHEYRTSYEKYVSSSASDNANYRFEINLSHKDSLSLKKAGETLVSQSLTLPYNFITWGNPHLSDLSFEGRSAEHSLHYNLVLKDAKTNEILWEHKSRLHYPKISKNYKKEIIPTKMRRDIKTITEHLVIEATSSLECSVDYYQLGVVSGKDNEYKIYAGREVGIQVGDQFLLSIDSNMFTRPFNDSNLTGLALARVKRVDEETAVLQHLAGAKPNGLGSISKSVGVLF